MEHGYPSPIAAATSLSPIAIHPSWLPVLTDPVRLTVLHALCALGTATTTELSDHTHTSDRALRKHLGALTTLGLVYERHGESDGETTGRPPKRFALDPRARDSATALFAALSEPLGPWPLPD